VICAVLVSPAHSAARERGAGSVDGERIAAADAEPHMRASLNGLIGVLGPRSGQKVLLRWELQT